MTVKFQINFEANQVLTRLFPINNLDITVVLRADEDILDCPSGLACGSRVLHTCGVARDSLVGSAPGAESGSSVTASGASAGSCSNVSLRF